METLQAARDGALHPPRLDPRLEALAQAVRPGARTADIGTDHGYLMAYLAASGKIPNGYACDINEKPLEKAALSLSQAGVSDRVKLVQCDGLSGLEAGLCDDLVLAGMGGDLIWRIIDEAPWTRDVRLCLVLQPMTRASLLRERLYEHGFALISERAISSKGFVYSIMRASYTGKQQKLDPVFALGGLLLSEGSMDARAYLDKRRNELETKVEGLRAARTPSEELAVYTQKLSALENLDDAQRQKLDRRYRLREQAVLAQLLHKRRNDHEGSRCIQPHR